MRNSGYLLSAFLVVLLAALFAVPFGATGCKGGNGNGDAGGDADAGPDPDDNKADGSFDLVMDFPGIHEIVRVEGKFDGRYLTLGYGGRVEYNQTEDRTEMQLFGLVTDRLKQALVMYLPRDCPTGQEINFGAGGVAFGTLDEVEYDDNNNEIGRKSVGEIIDGYIAFSHYDYNPDAQVEGTLEVHFRVVK